MKKILSLALVAALLAAFCLTAFAGTITALPDSETGTVHVSVKYTGTDPENPEPPVDPETVYAVELTWDSLIFTYEGAVEWDEENLKYTNGTWNNENGDIVVENRSNAGINVATGIDNETLNGATAAIANGNFSLGSAEGGTAPTGAIDITVSGNPTAAEFDIGIVTVSITAAP